MDYTRLGRTGLEVSRIALGCMTYGEPSRGNHSWTLNEEASRPLIRRAVELGITLFDARRPRSVPLVMPPTVRNGGELERRPGAPHLAAGQLQGQHETAAAVVEINGS